MGIGETLSKHDFDVLNSLIASPQQLKAPKYIETEAISFDIIAIFKAEAGDLQGALVTLNEAILRLPQYPSLLNNRAQMFRLLKDDEKAVQDLMKAVELLNHNPDDFTSLRVHEQLGWIMFKQGKNEEAQDFFKVASDLGSAEAKRMLVRCNPYSELCNAMFREALAQNVYFCKP